MASPSFPSLPPLPDAPRVRAVVPLRFEDLTQDGRLALEALPHALAPTLWRGSLANTEGARAFRAQGIAPILARLRLAGTAGPFSGAVEVHAEACARLTRTDDARFVLEMWADVFGGEGGALAGRVIAEHVLTRPFAAAGDRRVTRLDFPGAPVVTVERPALPPFSALAALPDGARAVDGDFSMDPTPIAFGVVHTDANKHVNSLVYLRIFEEAALRRFASIGRGSEWLARTVDIAYRRPCFSGQTMHVWQRPFEDARGALGVTAVLAPASTAGGTAHEALSVAHTVVRLGFER